MTGPGDEQDGLRWFPRLSGEHSRAPEREIRVCCMIEDHNVTELFLVATFEGDCIIGMS